MDWIVESQPYLYNDDAELNTFKAIDRNPAIPPVSRICRALQKRAQVRFSSLRYRLFTYLMHWALIPNYANN